MEIVSRALLKISGRCEKKVDKIGADWSGKYAAIFPSPRIYQPSDPEWFVPLVIPYPGTPGAPFFWWTEYYPLSWSLCSDLPSLGITKRFFGSHGIVSFSLGGTLGSWSKMPDWTAARSILRREYKDNDFYQLMKSREFSEALKKKPRSKDDDLMYYCQLFASISRELVSRQKLDQDTQCQWFLQGLPERIVIEIFYRYDIDLEEDIGLDFGHLLEKSLVLIKHREYLTDFIRDKETDLVNKYGSLDKVSIALNSVESFINPTPPIRLQEDIPVFRIHTLRIGEVKASRMSSDANECMHAYFRPHRGFLRRSRCSVHQPQAQGREKFCNFHTDSAAIILKSVHDTISSWEIRTQAS